MKINDSQKIFLVKNYDYNSIEELNSLFFEKYGIKIDKTTLAKCCRSIGLKRGQGAPGRRRKQGLKRNMPTKTEKDDFIKENINKLPFSEFCESFRMEFGENTSNKAIGMRVFRLGIERKQQGLFNVKEEYNSFLIENFHRFTYEELTKQFNQKFGTDISVYNLQYYCLKKLKLRKVHRLEIGEETKRGKRQMIKISNGNGQRNYKDKSVLAYQKEHGEIPKGYLVVCLDGDKNNCNSDNLCLLSRRELSVLAGCKWLGEERNNMSAKIQYAKLRSALTSQ